MVIVRSSIESHWFRHIKLMIYVDVCWIIRYAIEEHLFYVVFWRIAENRLQNDWFYIAFCNYWFANGCFILRFGSTDPS